MGCRSRHLNPSEGVVMAGTLPSPLLAVPLPHSSHVETLVGAQCGREEAFGKGADIGLILLIFVIPLLFGVRVTMAALTMVSDSRCLVAANNDVLAVRWNLIADRRRNPNGWSRSRPRCSAISFI
jgi:hypothetical protein